MDTTPQPIVPNDPDLLPAVRELLSQHPAYLERGACETAEGLFCLRYMNYPPHVASVEDALEMLSVQGDLLP
jgi:hypothetical protein